MKIKCAKAAIYTEDISILLPLNLLIKHSTFRGNGNFKLNELFIYSC